ncbi:FixH family protein [Arenimonas sp. GDDSR-1]|uniref:FixH family protein n=1 Tax=Arenimonas sp. GDDSR-1 TaxID=2950125 RepID=UPI0026327709|nr:FixH family protein [Arenimonas sp. GDDSR-1]
MTEPRRGWQEPMVWLMLGIPALTVIAGFYTLYLAFTSGPLDPVQASVQRVGKGQSLESPADSAASQGHYRAYLILDKQSNPWQLTLKTAPETLAALPVDVLFVHANLAKRDIRVRMTAGNGRLTRPLDFTPQQVVVTDAAGTWRLVGTYGESATIALTPAIDAP